MAEFTAKDVQRLRQVTGAGMLDCKRALEATGGDFDKAVNWLREKGLSQTGKRADRANEQGAVATANTGKAAAIVELKCETDFVAKSADFTALVHELAQAVAEHGEQAVDEFKEQLDNLRITLKENIDVGRVVRFEAVDNAVIDTYLHSQNDRGVNGVMVELVGGDRQLAHEVALHVASSRPLWLTRDEVPAERVEAEREVLENLTRNEGKPEQAIPKIVEGRVNAYFKDFVLVEQAFVKDTKKTIGKVLDEAGASVKRFARFKVGQA